MKKYNKSLFIFRRDYRINDNTTLIELAKNSEGVIPIFIFTPTQINDKKNSYKSHNAVKFLTESLEELNHELNNSLRIYYGDEYDIIRKLLIANPDINCIGFNKDYTKYSINRDTKIAKIAKQHKIDCISLDDTLLYPPLHSIKTTTNNIYTKYTPFYRKVVKIKPANPDNYNVKPIILSRKKYNVKGFSEYTAPLKSFYDGNKIGGGSGKLIEKSGRKAGLDILDKLAKKTWHQYNDCRNQLTYATTHLSPYNKFGCVSIREVYHAALKGVNGKAEESGIIGQLIWRDFFYNLSAKHPEIYDKDNNGVLNRDIKWLKDKSRLDAWLNAKTGYPIVDACMRELNTTGYLHNRGRLIVSNFLVRLLQINWKEGEKHFARMLYDYDPTQNSFGWQIAASISGTESRPISQMIYNPWIQSRKFDENANYIKRWIPELIEIPAKHLHQWDKHFSQYDLREINYVEPVINYAEERAYNLKLIS